MFPQIRTAGFTLIELLLVIALLVLLTLTGGVLYNQSQQRTRDAVRISDMEQLRVGFELFFIDHIRYPDVANEGISGGGEYIGDAAGNLEAALSQYMSRVPQDPLHDGVDFYYAYDPKHLTDDPYGSCNGSGGYYPVFGFHTAEASSTIVARRTCSGPDMQLNSAAYNTALSVSVS